MTADPRQASLVAVCVTVALLAASGCSDEADAPSRAAPSGLSASLREVAASMQRVVQYDYAPLGTTDTSLRDLAQEADLVGSGELVDAVDGYTVDYGPFADGGRDLEAHMLLIIEPSELAKGEELLAPSGLVHLDRPASEALPVRDLAAAVRPPGDAVAFFLNVVEPSGEDRLDEFRGRTEQDALFVPIHPSAALGVDEEREQAFPLFTDDAIQSTPENLAALEQAGTPVDTFGDVGHVDPIATDSP
jgi:hypothetical protein